VGLGCQRESDERERGCAADGWGQPVSGGGGAAPAWAGARNGPRGPDGERGAGENAGP
jgi:hypothetical protein